MRTIHRIRPAYSKVIYKNNYRDYKDNLKKDFNGSCGYCGSPDVVFGGKSGFQIDHFAPKSKFEGLEKSYTNLIYSCPICNRGKSNKWPTDQADNNIKGNEGFIHPCSKDYDDNLHRLPDGSIKATTEIGEYMRQVFKLYLFRHQVVWIREELRELIIEVEKHIDKSSELGQKHYELTAAFFNYDELLRVNIDSR